MCGIDGCEKIVIGQGLCSMHYNRAYRSGELVMLRPGRGVRVDNVFVEVSLEKRCYYAGYFDGEGCIYLDKPSRVLKTTPGFRHFPLHLEFSQTCPEVIMEMRTIYGGSLRVEVPENPKWRPSVQWCLTRTEAIHRFLSDVFPFLREKRAQAELIMRDYITPMKPDDGMRLRAELQRLKRIPLSIDDVLSKCSGVGVSTPKHRFIKRKG